MRNQDREELSLRQPGAGGSKLPGGRDKACLGLKVTVLAEPNDGSHVPYRRCEAVAKARTGCGKWKHKKS